ncbi:MAG: hypothetical protein A2Y79_03170 [Deltaproteobacteria bacterium RBG_13_43_22]|nr:MAG: hypothetical protein A2Y79_03170 [Deltaproteobacteria bacterium RBG_13_43_22]
MKRILLKNQPPFLKVLGLFLLLFPLLLSDPKPVWSRQAQIADSIVTNNQEYLLVYFITKGCFTPEMNKAIQNGIPTTFTFLIELYQPRSFWPNKRIASLKLHHTIKYDSLREEYSVLLSERGNQTFTVKEFSKAQEMMADVSNIQLILLKNLERNNQYQLRIKAELNKVRLPLYLHYLLFFVSLWDFETDWYVVDFIY